MTRPLRVTYFKAHLENKPGALLQVMKELKAKNLGLRGLWGYATDQTTADLFVVPKDPKKLRTLWASSGRLKEEGIGFCVQGTDRTGALNKNLEALSLAGVNIECLDAISVGKQYTSFIWVEPKDIEKAEKVLRSKR